LRFPPHHPSPFHTSSTHFTIQSPLYTSTFHYFPPHPSMFFIVFVAIGAKPYTPITHLSFLPFTCFFVVWLFTTLDLVSSTFNQQVLCNFWIDVLIEIFGFRSSLLHPLLQDKFLSNGSSNIPGFHRWSLFTPPLLGYWCVSSMRLRAF
jgi:hypothetical protein